MDHTDQGAFFGDEVIACKPCAYCGCTLPRGCKFGWFHCKAPLSLTETIHIGYYKEGQTWVWFYLTPEQIEADQWEGGEDTVPLEGEGTRSQCVTSTGDLPFIP